MNPSSDQYDIIIVGSGPSGMSAALNLQRLDPGLASRTLVLEKETHPRDKLCGGGLTTLSQFLLSQLNLDIFVRHIPINEICLQFEGKTVRYKGEGLVKIVRRAEFDAEMVKAARERSIEVREGVAVTGLKVESEGVALATTEGEFRCKAVVAADGVKGVIRRQVGLEGPSRIARAIEVLTPEDPTTHPDFQGQRIVVDFTPVLHGLQGYAWDFPSLVGGEPFMNRGAYDSRVIPERPNAPLKEMFRDFLQERDYNLDDFHLLGHPGRWFDPDAQFSVPRVLLTGDAAGIEPLGGDGIGSSLYYGQVVAQELVESFKSQDLTFSGYRKRLLNHPAGKMMSQRTRLARRVYGTRNPYMLRALWFFLRASITLRSLRQPKPTAS